MDYLDELRNELWKQSIGTENRVINRTYCEQISNEIYLRIERKINWETIRDFFEGNRKTSLPTLNKISAFVFNDPHATYQHFVEHCVEREKGTDELPDEQVLDELSRKKKNNQGKPSLFLNSRQKKAIIAAIVLILIGSLIVIALNPENRDNSNTSFTENYEVVFEGLTIDSLLQDGWKIKDQDLTLLDKYKDYPFLTLGTEIGDYFRLPGEEGRIERIKNLFYRKINCGSCCVITLKLKNFHPDQLYQTAGFLLFYGDSVDPRLYTRLVYALKAKEGEPTDQTIVFPQFYDYNSKEYQIRGGPRILNPLPLPWKLDPDLRTDSIWLRAHIKEGIYSFLYKRNRIKAYQYTYFNNGHDLEVPPPTMIAIGAWQGHSIDSAHLMAVDTIPVTFDQLTIEPCSD
jgi:hypothetical protein